MIGISLAAVALIVATMIVVAKAGVVGLIFLVLALSAMGAGAAT